MRLHHRILIAPKSGFSLLELLIAIFFGGIIVSSVGSLMVNNIRSAGKIENTQRARQGWNRVSHFIDSEVAQSERIILNSTMINLNQCSPSISAEDFIFALEIAPNLKPAIYYVKNNESNSKEAREDSSLWRCGPDFDLDGAYIDTSASQLEPQRLIDGLSKTKSCTLTVNSSNNTEGKSLTYTLCIIQSGEQQYSQEATAYSRVNPFYTFPSENTICNPNLSVEGFEELSGTNAGQSLVAGNNASIICGYGGGDTITGSSGNDVIEAGDSREVSGTNGSNDDDDDDEAPCGPGPPCTGNPSNRPACCFISSDSDSDDDDDGDSNNGGGSTSGNEPAVLNGGDGSDRLLGGPGDDSLDGGNGDDVLIGGEGNDSLAGGTGNDQYLPGAGNNTISDESGLDVVYVDQNQEDVSGLDNCTASSCNLNYDVEGSSSSVTTNGVDLIIFRDSRLNIRD